MRVAGSGIPGRSADDVRQHDEWYSEYLMLKDSKKKAIQEWKQGKEVCLFAFVVVVVVVVCLCFTNFPCICDPSAWGGGVRGYSL